MVLHVLRALFVLLMIAVGWFVIGQPGMPFGANTWLTVFVSVTIGVLLVCIDILSPRKKLVVFSGVLFGIVVGILCAYALSFVVQMMADLYLANDPHREAIIKCLNILVGVCSCYLAVSFILQTKDDFRFIIPYVEFKKQMRGPRPLLVDSSVLIDGRILDIVETGIIESRLIVPRFILQELQTLADSADKLKRARGRRGLDVLNKLLVNKKTETVMFDSGREEPGGADQKLLAVAHDTGAQVLTNDFNLSKVAQVQSITTININDLAKALRPVVLPGEALRVKLVKAGEDPSQGVGYLEDGTMVVVEQGRSLMNQEIDLVVNNVLQTSAGRMIFGRPAHKNESVPAN